MKAMRPNQSVNKGAKTNNQDQDRLLHSTHSEYTLISKHTYKHLHMTCWREVLGRTRGMHGKSTTITQLNCMKYKTITMNHNIISH